MPTSVGPQILSNKSYEAIPKRQQVFDNDEEKIGHHISFVDFVQYNMADILHTPEKRKQLLINTSNETRLSQLQLPMNMRLITKNTRMWRNH